MYAKYYVNDNRPKIALDAFRNWFIFGGLKPYSYTTANNHKNKYCKLSNVKQITLHEFRQSHASLLINKGVPITDISERL